MGGAPGRNLGTILGYPSFIFPLKELLTGNQKELGCRRKPNESLGGGRMGDSKVKVAVRIRPMNRRGESRAHLGPPRRRRQVPGAPFPLRRPPCGVRTPSPGIRIRAGGRPAHPETWSPAPPRLRGTPLPSPAPCPGAPRAPRLGPLPLPPALPPRPSALSPSIPLSSPALPGGRPCPSPPPRFLLPPLLPLGPCLAAFPLCPRQLSVRPPPLGSSPLRPGGDS